MYKSKYFGLADIVKAKYPKFQYKFKDQDGFMKLLGKIMFFNKDFMKVYTTTIGQTVYFPQKSQFDDCPDAFFETLCHEYVHIADDAKHPILFKLKYLFPQILAFPAILFILLSPVFITLMALSLMSPLWLLTLLSAVFLAPIPSPGRTQAELRGYGMSIKISQWEKYFTPVFFNFCVEAFTGSGYWYMCRNKDYITQELKKYVDTDDCLNDENPAYRDVYNFIKA